jgi:hypothetical protein
MEKMKFNRLSQKMNKLVSKTKADDSSALKVFSKGFENVKH